RDFHVTGVQTCALPILRSPWNFSRHGRCGRWVSDLFPEVARHVDDLCFIRSLQTEGVAHGPATLFLHTGATSMPRPSVGAWVSYGLGSLNANLPAFVTISPSLGNGGVRNFSNASLPAIHQGTPIGTAEVPADRLRIPHLGNARRTHEQQRRQF